MLSFNLKAIHLSINVYGLSCRGRPSTKATAKAERKQSPAPHSVQHRVPRVDKLHNGRDM